MLGSQIVKFLMSILSCWVNSFSKFASFLIVMTRNALVNSKLIYFLLWIKGFHQSHNFETFECCGENLPNCWCHFPNHKSAFLQILQDFSVSRKISLSYFFRSNIIYLARKGPIKVQIFETSECSDQNSQNSCHFWNKKSVFLKILRHCLVSWDITPPTFLAKILCTFNKRSLSKYKFGEISREQSKVSNFALWWTTFVQIIYSFS